MAHITRFGKGYSFPSSHSLLTTTTTTTQLSPYRHLQSILEHSGNLQHDYLSGLVLHHDYMT